MEPFDIDTPRLLLRPWRLTDAPDVLEYARDEEFSRFLPLVPRPYTARDAEEFVARAVLSDWTTRPLWAIVPKEEGRASGGINLRIQVEDDIAELGWSIARRLWNQGFMTEAATAVVAAAFERWQVAKVFARCDAENPGSWRVMEKLGMKREGHFRSQRLVHGERRAELQYGLLREEFTGRRTG